MIRPLQAGPSGAEMRGEETKLPGDEERGGGLAGPAGDVDDVEGVVEVVG